MERVTPAEASSFPPEDVSLPPVLEAEVRLIIWKARDVVAMDTLEDMNDLYVRCWIEGTEPQDTDIHWRAKKGKGSFNWRMKFDVTLPARGEGVGFLYLQCWDLDMLVNELLCESIFDLSVHLEEAVVKYQTTRMPYNCFITPPTKAEKKRRAEKLKQKAKLDKEESDRASAFARRMARLEQFSQKSGTEEGGAIYQQQKAERELLLKEMRAEKKAVLEALAGNASLTTLDLSANQLENCVELSSLIKLRTLKLNGNQITTMPSLSKLSHLESIDLTDNGLPSLEDLASNAFSSSCSLTNFS